MSLRLLRDRDSPFGLPAMAFAVECRHGGGLFNTDST